MSTDSRTQELYYLQMLLEWWNDAVVYPLAYIVAVYCAVVLLYRTVC